MIKLLSRTFRLFSIGHNKCHYTTIKNTEGKSQVTFPGLGFDDFYVAPNGLDYKPKSWRLLNYFDFAREISVNEGYLDLKEVENTHYTYVKCTNFERLLDRSFLLKVANKPFSFSFNIDTSLAYLGKTSMQLDHIMTDSNFDPLIKSSITFVFVDRQTRKPSSAPEWWVDRYKPTVSGDSRLIVHRIANNDHAFQHQILVGVLDLDYYGHANNCSYVKFGAEAIGAAFKSKYFGGVFQEADVMSSVKFIENSFLNECSMGDQLIGHVWSRKDDINCIVTNQQGNDVYQQIMKIDEEMLQK